ncbi:tRNA (adenosine(37)-N6)-dimethylallyltransferase MiaA [Arcanobacterium ihumii]|uniref:tRNA (adenosine(37)-N6)-dimethylallyltransferase MiaA n=1 Tax=Arcanobacterium ihumii TaxID=2138162 RepID=UPI000F52319D|nr:tRNA (adenosine(37)-N6)-dimethylallyltransferase MiaA [Arcanobacterium ihumii]
MDPSRGAPQEAPIICIAGATASGKTRLSIDLAYALGGPDRVEIISADAMQLYRGMNIGTAKITDEERRGVKHHQIDVLNISEEASVAAYQKYARRDLHSIHERGKIPIVVGGSGLYISGLLDELNFPGTDLDVRKELEQRFATEGLSPLVAELKVKDPTSAKIIDTANPRRVIRALEVVTITGKSFTPIFPRHTRHFRNTFFFGLEVDKQVLNERIETRVVQMYKDGLVEETEGLIANGLIESPTAGKATGYAQTVEYLHGNITLAEAIEQVSLSTRRLAKKQRTWFGADPRINWCRVSDDTSIDRHEELRGIADRIVKELNF